MDNRERRRAIQEHLAPMREQAATLVEDDVPAGYEPCQTYDDAMAGLICGSCHAVVPQRRAREHNAWHLRLYQRLGIS